MHPQQPYQVQPQNQVIKSRKRMSNKTHALLTLFTCGAWAPVWFAVWMWVQFGPRTKTTIRNY